MVEFDDLSEIYATFASITKKLGVIQGGMVDYKVCNFESINNSERFCKNHILNSLDGLKEEVEFLDFIIKKYLGATDENSEM